VKIYSDGDPVVTMTSPLRKGLGGSNDCLPATQSAIFASPLETQEIKRVLRGFCNVRAPERLLNSLRLLIRSRFSASKIEPVPYCPTRRAGRPSDATRK